MRTSHRWERSQAGDDLAQEAFQEALGRECRATLLQQREPLHLDDQRLLDQVVGAGGTPESFLYGGFVTSVAIRALLRMMGRPIPELRTILDFGCGPGRVTHWFRDLLPDATVMGTDVNPDAIDWCRKNIRIGMKFLLNEPLPPLEVPDRSVDLVYAISVFTHLDRNYQFKWLRELWRITRPGGLLLVTFHGDDKATSDLSEQMLAAYRRDGFLYRSAGNDPTVAGLPDFYQVAYHSPRYVAREWGRYFEPLLCVSHGPFWTQYGVVFRKREHRRAVSRLRRAPPMVLLPLTAIGIPAAGEQVHGSSVAVSGWSFYPNRPSRVRLQIWVDGRRSATLSTNGGDVPDVGGPEAPYADTRRAEFNVKLQLPELEMGPHTLWVTAGDSNIPMGATYFRTLPDTRSARVVTRESSSLNR